MALVHEQIDGKYEVLHKIREGGMGAIYKVRHRLLDEVRVVKVIRSHADPAGEAGERFLREARAAIRLRHPNIANLHDFAIAEDGQAFIVMEFIDGWSLLELLQGYGPPPLPLAFEVARQSLRALGYLHRHKIVHRDVSPDNLMLCPDVDGQPQVKLIDLGIAKTLEAEVQGLTTTGIFLGKPRYGSPERFSDRGFDERSDLYSFGVVFYELLTGRCPIRGTDAASYMAGHLFRPPLDFSETDPGGVVPEDLRRLLLKSLEKRPEDRVASAEDFLRELEPIRLRYPLSGRELGSVIGVLRPVSGADIAALPAPGSAQVRLDQEFGFSKTPPPQRSLSLVEAEATRLDRLAAAPAGPSRLDALETLEIRPGMAKVLAHPAAPAPALPDPTLPDPTLPMMLAAGPPSEATVRSPRTSSLDGLTLIRNEPRSKPEPPPSPIPAAAPEQPAEPQKRRKGLILLGVALAAALAAGGGWWALRPGPEALETEEISPPLPVPQPAAFEIPAKPAPEPEQPEAAEPLPERPAPAVAPVVAPIVATVEPPEPDPAVPFQRGDLIRRSGAGVSVPVPLEIPPYSYPDAAKGSGKKVSLRVSLLVDEEGDVIEASLPRPDKSGLGFNEAALEIGKRFRFQPATRDDVPGKMWTEVYLDFEE